MLNIHAEKFNISIGSKEFLVQDRFTIIKGKFKKSILEGYKNNVLSELLEKVTPIPLEKFIKIYLNRKENYRNIEKTLDLLELLNNFDSFMKKNIEKVSQYNKILNNFLKQIRITILLKEKNRLLKELEITEEYEKSSNIAAISDLLNKLNNVLIDNKRKLKYLEEDYIQHKNQIDQLNNTIKSYKTQIQDLTKKKKSYFSQINRITREMSGNQDDTKAESNFSIEIDDNLTNAQKIKLFQNKAREVQKNINDLKKKVEDTNIKLKEFNPLYISYKQDYNKLQEIIETDEQRIKELKLELKTKVLQKNNDSTKDYTGIDIKSIRSKKEVQNDLRRDKEKLETISTGENLSFSKSSDDFSVIIENLENLFDFLQNNQSEIKLTHNKEEILQIITSFQKLEILIDDLKSIINLLLSQINLSSSFKITLSSDNKNFFIQIGFTRNNKDKISFEELTTPEKIFFIIIYTIAIELQAKNQNIIFSNLFVPSIYNKAGSIYRTIRKILPVFEKEENYANYNLIFILSNLEMKKEIKNVKIITIQENK